MLSRFRHPTVSDSASENNAKLKFSFRFSKCFESYSASGAISQSYCKPLMPGGEHGSKTVFIREHKQPHIRRVYSSLDLSKLKSSIGHSLTHLASLIPYANFMLACLQRNRHRLTFILIITARERNGYVYLVFSANRAKSNVFLFVAHFLFFSQIQLLYSRKLFGPIRPISLSPTVSLALSRTLSLDVRFILSESRNVILFLNFF